MHRPDRFQSMLFVAASALSLSACATVSREINEAIGNNFAATLSGANEVPAGDPDGAGSARISINDVTNQVCTHLEVRNIGPVTAAHIHRGAPGVNGPPVINLDVPDDNDSDDCDTVADDLVDAIIRDPAAFYVNVHTPDYPNGAIRGQIVNTPS